MELTSPQKHIYMWNNSHRKPTGNWQKISFIQPKLQERSPCHWVGWEEKGIRTQDAPGRYLKEGGSTQASPHPGNPLTARNSTRTDRGTGGAWILVSRRVHVLACYQSGQKETSAEGCHFITLPSLKHMPGGAANMCSG